MLVLASGVLGAVDPFASMDKPFAIQLDAGRFPVVLTVASQPDPAPQDHFEDAAYLSVILREGAPASVAPVPGTVVDGQLHGVTTWGSSLGFVDATAARGHGVDRELLERWIELSDAHPHGALVAALPWGSQDENVIAVGGPHDEGNFPLYLTRDASGCALGIHIDFLVAGTGRLDLDVRDWPPRSG